MATFSFRSLFKKDEETSVRRETAGSFTSPSTANESRAGMGGMGGTMSAEAFFQVMPAGPVSPFTLETPPSGGQAAQRGGFPFSMARLSENFTAGELAALVPAEFVRAGGVPPHQEVTLPLDVLRASLEAGRPSVKLSELCAACPALFFSPPTAVHDFPVNLPPQKVRRIVDAAAGATSPSAPESHSGGRAVGEALSPVGLAAASPFAVAGSSAVSSMAGGTKLPPPRQKTSLPEPKIAFPASAGVSSNAASFAQTFQPAAFGNPLAVQEPGGSETAAGSQPPSSSRDGRPAFQPTQPMATYASPFAVADEVSSPPPPPAVRSAPPPASALPPGAPFSVVARSECPSALESPFAQQPVAPPPLPPQGVGDQEPVPASAVPVVPPMLPTSRAVGLPRDASVPPATVWQSATISLGLGVVLRNVPAPNLGFQPEKIPESVRVALPLQPIFQQLGSGRVVVPLQLIIDSLDPRLQPAFARSQRDLAIQVPLHEIFGNLPAEMVSDKARGTQPAPVFDTPFALKAEEDSTLAQTLGTPVSPPLQPAFGARPIPAPAALLAAFAPGIDAPGQSEPAGGPAPRSFAGPTAACPPPPAVASERRAEASSVPPSPPVWSTPVWSPPTPPPTPLEPMSFMPGLPAFPPRVPAAPAEPSEPPPRATPPPITSTTQAATTAEPSADTQPPAFAPPPLPEEKKWPSDFRETTIGPPPASEPSKTDFTGDVAVSASLAPAVGPAAPPAEVPAVEVPAAVEVAAAASPSGKQADELSASTKQADEPSTTTVAVDASATGRAGESPDSAAAEPPVTPPAPFAPPAGQPAASLQNPFASAPGAFSPLGRFELPLPVFDDEPMPLESLEPLVPSSSPAASSDDAGSAPPAAKPAEPASEAGEPPAEVVEGIAKAEAVPPPPKPSATPRPFTLPPIVRPPVVAPASPPPPVAPASATLPPAESAPLPPAASAGSEASSPLPTIAPGMPAAHTMPPLPPVAVRSAPRFAPPITPPRFTSPVEDLTFGYVDDPTQLALRAIFSTEKTMRPQDIVDFSSQFPGIRGSLIITPEGVTRSGRLDDSDEVRHFSEKASVLYEKTSSLITELGLGTEQTFTLRTGRGIMSFFTHGSICLAVLHGEPNFHPGVREKLILVARELAKMLAA